MIVLKLYSDFGQSQAQMVLRYLVIPFRIKLIKHFSALSDLILLEFYHRGPTIFLLAVLLQIL